jgi:hypothetical protein
MRKRMITPMMTSGFFIQRGIMPKVRLAAKLAHSIFPVSHLSQSPAA